MRCVVRRESESELCYQAACQGETGWVVGRLPARRVHRASEGVCESRDTEGGELFHTHTHTREHRREAVYIYTCVYAYSSIIKFMLQHHIWLLYERETTNRETESVHLCVCSKSTLLWLWSSGFACARVEAACGVLQCHKTADSFPRGFR